MLSLNEKYAKLIGDGHVHLEYNSNKKLFESFKSLLNELEIKFKIDHQPGGAHKPINNIPVFSGASIRARFNLPQRLAKSILREKKKYQKYKIPRWVINNNQNICGFLRGFFDDGGSVDLVGRTIRLYNSNKSILQCVKNLLTLLHIKSEKICNGESYFVLHINGYYNILRFAKLVGTNHPKKLKKLNLLLQKYKPTKIKILELLSVNPKTPRELAKILGRSDSDICILLKILIFEKKVFLWEIKDSKKFYYVQPPSSRPQSQKEKIKKARGQEFKWFLGG